MKRVLILTANTALGVLCCFILAWGIINPVIDAVLAPDLPEAEPGAASAASSPRDRADRRVVLQRNLFNVSTLNPTPVASEEDEYEKTKLPLRLLGTAVSNDRALSWAAIEDLESKQHLSVRLEQEIKGGARVLKIERRRIVLQNGGRREELVLEGDLGPPVSSAAQRPRPQARRLSVDRSEVQNLAANPSAIFSQARILPKYEGGQMVGVQLSAIKPGSQLEQYGLQNGDTITAVDGQPIGPEGTPQLFQKLTQGGDFRVSVRGENGTPRDIDIDVNQR